MYAVVQTGGKQYRVAPGDYITVERLPGESGDKLQLSDILLVDHDGKVAVGSPFVKEASVTATIVEQSRAAKIIVFKKKRRKNYRRTKGHRQQQTVLFVSEIKGEGKTVKADKEPKLKKDEKAPVKKAVAEKESPVKAAPKKAEPKTETKKAPAKKAEPKKAAKTEESPKKASTAKKSTATKKTEK